jgi:hypothetical protein
MTRDREGRGGEAVGVLSRSGPERQWDGTVKSKAEKGMVCQRGRMADTVKTRPRRDRCGKGHMLPYQATSPATGVPYRIGLKIQVLIIINHCCMIPDRY